jgi:hypothetical protein
MEAIHTETKWERGPAGDLWFRTLSQVPTTFGRLAYLSSLRDPNSGVYQHYGLAQAFGDEESDRTLRQSHSQVFYEWLCFGLERQKDDLEEYFHALPDQLTTVLAAWQSLFPYKNLVPTTAREAERRLFLADLETLLELLKNEHGVASPDPDA